MKAKCPHCSSSATPGCNHCTDGYISVGVARGDLYTLYCPDCGRQNGGCVVNDKHPLPPMDRYTNRCVECDGKRVRYLKVGVIE